MKIWGEAGLIDRCGLKRTDSAWVRRQWDRADALLLTVDRRGNPHMVAPDALRLSHPDETYDDQRHLFLGVVSDQPLFASQSCDEDGMAMRDVLPLLAQAHQELVVEAASLIHWHRSHPYCPRCGGPTTMVHGGFARLCTAEGSEHFPRHDPAMIVAVTDAADRLLLAHQGSWAPGRFSVLAGFVEAGESLEQTVHREVYEEVGIEVTDIEYVASQPWPFPRSLMFAYRARALTTNIQVDGVEIQEAHFMTREQVRAKVAAGEMSLAGSASVSAHLIATWLESEQH